MTVFHTERVAEVALTFGPGVGLWRDGEDAVVFFEDAKDLPFRLPPGFDFITVCVVRRSGELCALAFARDGVGVASLDEHGVSCGLVPRGQALRILLDELASRN